MKKAQTSKQAQAGSTKARQVVKNSWQVIERVWAENGVVIVVTKSGKRSTMTVGDAAVRAQQINAMILPQWHRASRDKLVETIIQACRDAKKQQESPANTTERAVTNLLSGKTESGKTPDQLLASATPHERMAISLGAQLPHLDYSEILGILREPKLDMPRKMQLLEAEDSRRAMEKLHAGKQRG